MYQLNLREIEAVAGGTSPSLVIAPVIGHPPISTIHLPIAPVKGSPMPLPNPPFQGGPVTAPIV